MLVNQVYAFYASWTRPASPQVETFGSGTIENDGSVGRFERRFDLRPAGGRLACAFAADSGYRALAAYGPMGRTELGLLRERLDQSEEIAQ